VFFKKLLDNSVQKAVEKLLSNNEKEQAFRDAVDREVYRALQHAMFKFITGSDLEEAIKAEWVRDWSSAGYHLTTDFLQILDKYIEKSNIDDIMDLAAKKVVRPRVEDEVDGAVKAKFNNPEFIHSLVIELNKYQLERNT
jgi:hypothetical protein